MEGAPDNRIVATGGLYAPTIRHHVGKTYIVCKNVKHIYHDRGSHQPASIEFQNFIISTEDIWSDAWSDPVFFDF